MNRYLLVLTLIFFGGCTTTRSELSFGSLRYVESATSFHPNVQPVDTVALASAIASNGSMWNSPLLKSAANMLFSLVRGK